MGSRSYLLPAAAVLGLAGGFAAARLGGRADAAVATAAESSPAPSVAASSKRGGPQSKGRDGVGKDKKITLVKPGPLPKSTDTVESLLKLERGPLYSRLGLWLLDATEEDMAAFWDGYHDREDPNDTIKDLLFTQWGKLNAAGMLAAARSTGCEISSMWSWAMSDPQGMLAYIEGKDPKMRNYGLRGLAYFHPELARKMLDEDPTLANTFEMEQLAAQLGKGDPKAEFDFLAKYRRDEYYLRQALGKWAAQDPYRAFDWLTEHGGFEGYERVEFFNAIKKERPEVLPELAALLPSGAERRQIEAAAFANLAETDPDKAAEEAAKIEAPRLAAERLSTLGKTLAEKDPDRALELLGQLYAICPDVAGRMTWIRYPDGGASGGGGVQGFSEFISAMAAKQPEQTLQTLLTLEEKESAAQRGMRPDRASRQVGEQWAQRDLPGFSDWVDTQTTPELKDMGASIVTDQFRNKSDFANASAWAMRIADPNVQSNSLVNLMSYWTRSDKAAAQSWYDQAELPESTRKQLAHYFRPNQQ
ncbi:hypothetical protein [Haloferula sp. BvORR071]|uniref:hypothetical protein n=1 Tax=Haloferula sp. BvORR071 TaxID=1396141 RepID=UPI00054D421C|nr:hypothetical protein [Haloferula sp. BvORR071]